MLELPLRAAHTPILPLCVALAGCGQSETKTSEKASATAKQEPATEKRTATAPANGWGEEIAWRPLTDGLAEAKKERMPLMLVVHTSWCSKCKALKQSAFSSQELRELSEEFVMVNVDQDAEPAALDYAPDGSYIPRVMFLDPEGTLDQQLRNPRPSRYKYFYMPQDDLVGTMRKALERHADDS